MILLLPQGEGPVAPCLFSSAVYRSKVSKGSVKMLPQRIIEQLIAIVGESRLLLEADDLQRFGVDRTTLWQAAPCGVVLPGTVEEVQSIVRLANQCNLAIVPSGGRTGLRRCSGKEWRAGGGS